MRAAAKEIGIKKMPGRGQAAEIPADGNQL